MNDLIILANQTPGVVTFENYDEVKTALQTYINETFSYVDSNKPVLISAHPS